MTSGGGRSFTYAGFDAPQSVANSATSASFNFDDSLQRSTQVATEGTTVYIAAAGVLTEKFTQSGTGAVTWRSYIMAGGQRVGMVTEAANAGTLWHSGNWGSITWSASAAASTTYFHQDHLGSVVALTGSSGTTVEQDAYDPWGKRRNTSGADDPNDTIASQTTRGFTDQEHLADSALIHMNARVYDPQIGKFTGTDPVDGGGGAGSQAWNRYAYGSGNPLRYTDPTGMDVEDGLSDFLSGIGGFLNSLGDAISSAFDTSGSSADASQFLNGTWKLASTPIGGVDGNTDATPAGNGPATTTTSTNGAASPPPSGTDEIVAYSTPRFQSISNAFDPSGLLNVSFTYKSSQQSNQRQASNIDCGTSLPDGSTVGGRVASLSDAINNSNTISTPFGSVTLGPLNPYSVATSVYNGTNFRRIFGGPGANYVFLGDAGNFAYGAVSANIGVPLNAAEAVAVGYAYVAHSAADRVGPYGMDQSATTQVPAGYVAACKATGAGGSVAH